MRDLTLAPGGLAGVLNSFLKTPLADFYGRSTHRLLMYFLLAGIFFIEGLFALTMYKGPTVLGRHMAFSTVYALHTALTYAMFQLAADLLARRAAPKWGGYSNRTVGMQWLIWGGGFAAGFFFHRSAVLCLVHHYAPDIVAYYASSQHSRPGHTAVFLYTLAWWTAGVGLVLHFMVQVQKTHTSLDKASTDKCETQQEFLRFRNNGRHYEIAFSDISHVSVEDHYSRIHYCKDGALENVFVRLTLSSLRQSLPEALFVQIHRSHLVNLRHVAGFSNSRRRLAIGAGGRKIELPVSRYRLAEFRTRMALCSPIKAVPAELIGDGDGSYPAR